MRWGRWGLYNKYFSITIYMVKTAEENLVLEKESNKTIYFLTWTVFLLLISLMSLYWHSYYLTGNPDYVFISEDKHVFWKAHIFITGLLALAWPFASLLVAIIIAKLLIKRRKVNWKAIFFFIAVQIALFIYLKYSTFLSNLLFPSD